MEEDSLCRYVVGVQGRRGWQRCYVHLHSHTIVELYRALYSLIGFPNLQRQFDSGIHIKVIVCTEAFSCEDREREKQGPTARSSFAGTKNMGKYVPDTTVL